MDISKCVFGQTTTSAAGPYTTGWLESQRGVLGRRKGVGWGGGGNIPTYPCIQNIGWSIHSFPILHGNIFSNNVGSLDQTMHFLKILDPQKAPCLPQKDQCLRQDPRSWIFQNVFLDKQQHLRQDPTPRGGWKVREASLGGEKGWGGVGAETYPHIHVSKILAGASIASPYYTATSFPTTWDP